MKKTLLAATLACTALATATEPGTAPQSPAPAPAVPAAPVATKPAAPRATQSKAKKDAAAEAALVEQFVNLQDAAIATFLELGSTLRGVKDKESAEAAVPAIRMAGEQLGTIISAVVALGEPSEAAQQAIMARVANVSEKNEVVERVMLPLLTLMMQEPPCYGSEALQHELSTLLANLQGAARADGEDAAEADDSTELREPDADEPAEGDAR